MTNASLDAETLQPAFTVNPNETAYSAISRIMAMLPDSLHFRNSTAVLAEYTAAEASAYALGGTHAILGGKYSTKASRFNRVQVQSSNAWGEAFTWAEIELILDQVGYVLDKKLAGATPTNDRASDELRRHALLAKADLVDIPTHCGLEINDVVDLTESRAGLSAAKRRVRGITTHYDKAKATYHQLVALGEV